MHVACTLLNASNRIDGKYFVPIDHNNKKYLVSEDLSESDGKRLLSIPGYELFRGESKLIADAITKFKQDQVHAVESGDQAKDRMIKELQTNCSILSDQLGKANMKIVELQEESVQLKSAVGEPSMAWSLKRLADHAEGMGLLINKGLSKEDILEMIDAQISEKG